MQRAAELQLPMPGAMRLVLLDNDITGIELAWSACGTEDVGKVSDAAADSGCKSWASSHAASSSELIVAPLELSRCSASFFSTFQHMSLASAPLVPCSSDIQLWREMPRG
ncbi:hypothetical protein HBI56_029790 [Parastagonospora nodorum]|uniref:Uncharacterized protein n=1 Tax=Phaeosphaeria nodorum (strain SN15 / ATCC MYA-4574 / FGSC 10173) TaxID=321614 RepID=A0A7U2F1X3_PHANO|nr:hypothetical protein HBH56_017400 [Parastagonospora nodorum]QRC95180.1 hypothetical protein JI435_431910 [Parastagonospora nodorum SN15]KAH3936855.1 hypothetical protein HBH54_017080 [Parastagonospora nodorum]KAH3953902.1 hypothetical protein HBH53_029450 [Parastagonospora nodorum]KAH3962594.1 hypothetical protein HBH51_172540 [Parastagonospora nodorum]